MDPDPNPAPSQKSVPPPLPPLAVRTLDYQTPTSELDLEWVDVEVCSSISAFYAGKATLNRYGIECLMGESKDPNAYPLRTRRGDADRARAILGGSRAEASCPVVNLAPDSFQHLCNLHPPTEVAVTPCGFFFRRATYHVTINNIRYQTTTADPLRLPPATRIVMTD
jgi:hypothetical protein